MKNTTVYLMLIVLTVAFHLAFCYNHHDLTSEKGTIHCNSDAECPSGHVCQSPGFGKGKGQKQCFPESAGTTIQGAGAGAK